MLLAHLLEGNRAPVCSSWADGFVFKFHTYSLMVTSMVSNINCPNPMKQKTICPWEFGSPNSILGVSCVGHIHILDSIASTLLYIPFALLIRSFLEKSWFVYIHLATSPSSVACPKQRDQSGAFGGMTASSGFVLIALLPSAVCSSPWCPLHSDTTRRHALLHLTAGSPETHNAASWGRFTSILKKHLEDQGNPLKENNLQNKPRKIWTSPFLIHGNMLQS